jgi:transcriptional regulator with XRE-family HTH domain
MARKDVRINDLPYELDYVAYLDAVSVAAREMGSSLNKMCTLLGISASTISELRKGARGRRGMTANKLINIAAWSGVDIKPYVRDNDNAKMPISTLADQHPTSYPCALRVIEALREKLACRERPETR